MRLFRNPPSGLDAILNRPPETFWDRLVASPITTIARYLSTFFPVSFPAVPREDAVTVVCISDTHNTRPRLPPGDILVHAGDLTVSGTRAELRETVNWIKAQEHRFKVVVAGNHDLCLDERLREGEEEGEVDWGDVVYLDCASATLKVPVAGGIGSKTREIRVYGSPYTPQHGNWAFQYPRSGPLDPWAGRVPAGTDVLVTHAPPKGHMDDPQGNWGCEMLLRELWRVRPRLHVFGHVHCGHGVEAIGFDEVQGAWEDVVLDVSKGGRGITAFARMMRACIGVWWRGGRRGRGETVLVNAAVVGGIGDRLVREAAVVRI
ncbi:putative rhamnogalacturonate lyase C [Colletotrichum gloeosporioides]|uniref:Putative rhamnogalacturonate lyase C n=1 Tax=Colletotrichum gloeosporioides TaxID=474922 RepID=A0A8H4CB91_COLGL|nr:putative rhamnogalacturonate lyase C [Colletotrichum gloeosporioides]KAF3800647.1 putative rhamnogalacturonate lyase C [Colletotrichum gloeosporioides]